MMNTCSMAMVGTSAMRMRRRALAMAASVPISSNSMSVPRTQLTTTLNFFLNLLNDQLLSMPNAANRWALSAVETCHQDIGALKTDLNTLPSTQVMFKPQSACSMTGDLTL